MDLYGLYLGPIGTLIDLHRAWLSNGTLPRLSDGRR